MVKDSDLTKLTKYMIIPVESIGDIEVEDTLLYKGNSFDSDESQLVEVKNIIDSVPIIYDEITNTDVKINQENIDKFFFLVRKA